MIVKEIERGLSLSTWTKNFNVDFLEQREEYPGGFRKESRGQGGQRMSTLSFFENSSKSPVYVMFFSWPKRSKNVNVDFL